MLDLCPNFSQKLFSLANALNPRFSLYCCSPGVFPLLFAVVSGVPPLMVFALTPLWPTAGFLLYFEEGIHVIGKDSSSFRLRIVLFRFIEMPHFVDALNYISFLQCFLQFVHDPCSMILLRRYVDTVSVDGFHYMFNTE